MRFDFSAWCRNQRRFNNALMKRKLFMPMKKTKREPEWIDDAEHAKSEEVKE